MPGIAEPLTVRRRRGPRSGWSHRPGKPRVRAPGRALRPDRALIGGVYAPAAHHDRKATMADDLDDVAGPDELTELDDEALTDTDDLPEDPDLAADDLDEEDLAEDLDESTDEEEKEEEEEVPSGTLTTTTERHEDGEEEEEEEPEDEDIEASLDVILKERLVVEDEPEDEEVPEVEERGEPSERIRPKQPDEFVCRSCFLVKHPSQLA